MQSLIGDLTDSWDPWTWTLSWHSTSEEAWHPGLEVSVDCHHMMMTMAINIEHKDGISSDETTIMMKMETVRMSGTERANRGKRNGDVTWHSAGRSMTSDKL
jgi:hypothetical protein